MKTQILSVKRFSLAIAAGAVLSLSLLLAGCGGSDIDKPLDRTPNVPPSTRGSGGGVPGNAGDINKKKKTSSYFPAARLFEAESAKI